MSSVLDKSGSAIVYCCGRGRKRIIRMLRIEVGSRDKCAPLCVISWRRSRVAVSTRRLQITRSIKRRRNAPLTARNSSPEAAPTRQLTSSSKAAPERDVDGAVEQEVERVVDRLQCRQPQLTSATSSPVPRITALTLAAVQVRARAAGIARYMPLAPALRANRRLHVAAARRLSIDGTDWQTDGRTEGRTPGRYIIACRILCVVHLQRSRLQRSLLASTTLEHCAVSLQNPLMNVRRL